MLLVSYDHPPNDGGISRLSAGIAQELASRGQAPHVVTVRRPVTKGPCRPQCRHSEVSPTRGFRDWETLRRLLATHRRSPVLATAWNPEGTLAILAHRRRLVILAHGNEVMAYNGRPLKALLRRWVLERARAVVCNSTHTARLVTDIAPSARTCVIRPAVDADRLAFPAGRAAARATMQLPQDKRILLTVSRLDAMKGHETVLRAVAALAPGERARLLYVIAGRGPNGARLQELVRELGLAGSVRFLGFVEEDWLPALYAAAELFILCSIEDRQRNAVEGFGMALIEAQSAGTPVVGTRSGGIPDAVRAGEGGWIVAERDEAAVAGLLRQLLAEPERFREEGAKGRRRILGEMSWGSYVDALLELL